MIAKSKDNNSLLNPIKPCQIFSFTDCLDGLDPISDKAVFQIISQMCTATQAILSCLCLLKQMISLKLQI